MTRLDGCKEILGIKNKFLQTCNHSENGNVKVRMKTNCICSGRLSVTTSLNGMYIWLRYRRKKTGHCNDVLIPSKHGIPIVKITLRNEN